MNKDSSDDTNPEQITNSTAQEEITLQDTLSTEQIDANGSGNFAQSMSDLGMILDIPVTLSLELGSTKINIGDLMRLNKGSIVELEKEASEPLEVMVNGTLVAYAEVVVINDKYGIRLLDVISESERLKKLA